MGGERLVAVAAIALVPIVRFGQEARKGVAAVLMTVLLDEENFFVRSLSPLEDDHVRGIDGHDLDLVTGQRGLESRQLGDATGSFRNARQSMEFFGFLLLDGVPPSQIPVIVVLGTTVRPGLHGDEGAGAAQGILVFDVDDGSFDEASHGRRGRFVAVAVATRGTWGADEGRFQVEGVVGGEGLIGVEFLSKGLQVRGQPLAVLSDFAHAEGGGLEGVVKRLGSW